MTLIAKPFITIYGNEIWCDQMEKVYIPNLPMEPTAWFRQTGSDFKLVHVDIDTKKFNEQNLKDFGNSILNGPLFHLFIIIENEDTYTKKDKDLFAKWIGALRARSIETWKLFVLPDDSQKSKFSFNRSSVSNRIKSDFNIQKIENHLIKIGEDPNERFVQIQAVMRDIILKIYDERCFSNEDKIRIQRENRFTPQWNYFEYFSLQEELADIYECLSLYDESLAQFDETNFVFIKCMEGFYKGESSQWINNLKDIPFDIINCLILTNFSDPQKRHDLSKGRLCLADFRAYLLSRQCALLQFLNKYQQMPSLVYSALINFLNECKLLKLDIDSSIKNSWIYLTSMEVLQRFNPIDCDIYVSQDYAALFLLALNSINKLAEDWNIWVKDSVNWSPIETLTGKLSVLNHDEYGDTPSSRLSGGLRSQKHFQQFHTKLYEEALVILKHIGRIRSANLIGVQLADLYCQIGNYEDAEPFYLKAIKCFRNENWTHLAMPLRLKLATCQKDQFDKNPEKYLKTCVHLAGSTFSNSGDYFNQYLSLKNDYEHNLYFDELKNYINKYFDKFQTPQVFKIEPLFSIKIIKLLSPVDGYQVIELVIISHLPKTVEIKLSLSGQRFSELDFTKSENIKTEHIDIHDNYDELKSIPLTDISSPQIHKRHVESKRKELICQSSMEEDLHTLNTGVAVHINASHNIESNKDDSILTLICFPKADAGLKARKFSISRDTIFSDTIPEISIKSETNKEESTKFIPMINIVELKPGQNNLILKSEEIGLFLPKNIEINLFNKMLHLKDIINESKIDHGFYDMRILETFLPDFFVEDTETIGFVNFTNEVKAKIKMGLLSLSNIDTIVELCVKSDDCKEMCSSQKIAIDKQIDQQMVFGSEVSLCGPLAYNIESINDKITLRIPGLIKKELKVDFFEQIRIIEKIIPTTSTKYVVKIELQKPPGGVKCKVNYIINHCSLKLHHDVGLCQLLPSVHRSSSTGNFNEQMQFTLLWFIENVDILNFTKDSLKFTLSLDLIAQLNEKRYLNGYIHHEFELNHYFI